ncbi:MAG TPA: hypothetical protein PLY94_00155, partial [Gemmatimonadaceae bacterium]|nr:hypothetical protein [Gemmatimonadaceae bacterium]
MLWFGARLSLALRRTRGFLRWWLGVGGAATVVALLLPVAIRTPETALAEALARSVADSLRSGQHLTRAIARAATAESLSAAAATRPAPPRTPTPARPATADESLARAIAIARQEGEALALLFID